MKQSKYANAISIDMKLRQQIIDVLRDEIESRNKTTREIAVLLDVHHPEINKIFSKSATTFKLSTLIHFAEKLGVNVDINVSLRKERTLTSNTVNIITNEII